MDLIDGLETKDLCASKQLRRALAAALFIRNNPVLCFGVSAGSGVCMCMKKVFSLQFHAGKRRDDILKDPGMNQRCFVMMDFLRHPEILLEWVPRNL